MNEAEWRNKVLGIINSISTSLENILERIELIENHLLQTGSEDK